MTSLLPPNATSLERNLENVTDYKVNANLVSGFKFKTSDFDTWMKLALSWEYSLSKIKVENFADRIKQGVEFHRYSGTPYALKIAFGWYNFNNVIIEEEVPGTHFAEFQIGLDEIPNGFEVDTIIDVAKMAAPARSKLSRMYNSLYDVRRFMLDESKFGDILSDNSGIRLKEDGPKLSFGRSNTYTLKIPEISAQYSNTREHYSYAKNSDTYKLDFGCLDDLPSNAINHKSSVISERYFRNTDRIGKPFTIQICSQAKALVVLSESKLEDINSCLSGYYEKITEAADPFTLSFSRLSQHKIIVEQIPIEERFFRDTTLSATNPFIPSASKISKTGEYVAVCKNTSSVAQSSQIRETFCVAKYRGNNTWHGHSHFDVSWNKQSTHTRMT